MSHDPDQQRDTPLARRLKERIRRAGPITVGDFVSACLRDPRHGYYSRREAIGAAGDFITSAEISQVFGELIGLWCAVVWYTMGRPDPVHLVELGPGRGTMMRDALRALAIVPAFLAAVRVHLVEKSETLGKMQRLLLADAKVPISWWKQPWDAPRAPSIVIANEFLDTYAVDDQLIRTGERWATRGVIIDEPDQLKFAALDDNRDAEVPAEFKGAAEGAIVEVSRYRTVADELPWFAWDRMAALFIDYGYDAPALGETLQAVRSHAHEHPLRSPGEADLSAHVDFSAFASSVRLEGFCVDGPVTQAEFLGSLGIMERASRLMAENPRKAGAIESGVARLMAPNGMGTRFKAIGVRSRQVPSLAGFPAQKHDRALVRAGGRR